LGNLGAGGHRKKVVKNTNGEKILEVGEGSGDQNTARRQALEDQRLWPLTPQTGICEQQHSITQRGFLSVLPWPAAISLMGGGTLRPGEHSPDGEGENKCLSRSSMVKALISLVL